ncbi:MAG: F0F1 ATP synthase subunit delta [Patescibacteria group bacterium]
MSISPQQYANLLYDSLSGNRPLRKKIILDFVTFVVSKKDQDKLPKIIEEISDLIDRKNQTLFIDIVSSSPLNNLHHLSETISKKIDQPVEVSNIIDEKLIGGQIVYSSDWKIDFSVKSILQKRPVERDQKLPKNLITALEELQKSI